MGIVHVRLIMRMTENAFERSIIFRNNVTIGAIVPFLGVAPRKNGEILPVVIPVRIPAVGIMTHLAISGEPELKMIGIGGAIIVARVAGVTVGRRILVTVGVAGNAFERKMSAGQRELGLAVIELRRAPAARGMALGAVMAEIVGDMVGILN